MICEAVARNTSWDREAGFEWLKQADCSDFKETVDGNQIGLNAAIIVGSVSMVEKFVAKSNVNAKPPHLGTPLKLAAVHGYIEIVQALLAHKAADVCGDYRNPWSYRL